MTNNQTNEAAANQAVKPMICDKIAKVQEAVAQFGFSAVVATNDLIVVRNRKNEICANVTVNGVEQKYSGQKNLCGALARNAINTAIKS